MLCNHPVIGQQDHSWYLIALATLVLHAHTHEQSTCMSTYAPACHCHCFRLCCIIISQACYNIWKNHVWSKIRATLSSNYANIHKLGHCSWSVLAYMYQLHNTQRVYPVNYNTVLHSIVTQLHAAAQKPLEEGSQSHASVLHQQHRCMHCILLPYKSCHSNTGLILKLYSCMASLM